MTTTEVFDAWAPRESVWSVWAKPVLFAHLPRAVSATTAIEPQVLPFAPAERTAIILDLPGAAAIPLALDLASRGHRPVPLYNACPAGAAGGTEVVPVRPILDALTAAADALRELAITPDAPPVFLLDADRRGLGRPAPTPGQFDNRSVSLPTDFPSAAFLASQSVTRVLLVQSTSLLPQPDLAHTLRRYQRAGIELTSMALLADPPRPPTPLRVPRPPLFGFALQRFLAVMGLRRNPLGGFGGTLPEPSNG